MSLNVEEGKFQINSESEKFLNGHFNKGFLNSMCMIFIHTLVVVPHLANVHIYINMVFASIYHKRWPKLL
jgi:hypothetical protein